VGKYKDCTLKISLKSAVKNHDIVELIIAYDERSCRYLWWWMLAYFIN